MKKVVKPKSTNLTRCSTNSASKHKILSQIELKKLKLCMKLICYFQFMFAKFHPNPTIFRVRRLDRKNVVKRKNKNFMRCPNFSASNDRISTHKEISKLKFCMYLVNYYHYMCAKIQPIRTILSVKGLPSKKVVKPKSTNFTRCSTYSASNDKISGQGELKKLKLRMYLINYLHYVCAKFHPNRTTFRVRGLAKKKVVKPKSTSLSRCSTYSASNQKKLESSGM